MVGVRDIHMKNTAKWETNMRDEHFLNIQGKRERREERPQCISNRNQECFSKHCDCFRVCLHFRITQYIMFKFVVKLLLYSENFPCDVFVLYYVVHLVNLFLLFYFKQIKQTDGANMRCLKSFTEQAANQRDPLMPVVLSR